MEFATRLRSINPYDLTEIEVFESYSNQKINALLAQAQTAFGAWKLRPIQHRTHCAQTMAQLLREKSEQLASMITLEMGKPLREAIAEVDKCAWLCEYYAENAASQLHQKYIKTDASESFVTYEPLGVIYGIMPWNFPFWQVYRFAIPATMAGNTVVLKHAPNVSKCALLIHELFAEAGFCEGVFTSILLENERASQVIEHPFVKAVSLTGSEHAGRAVAKTAGAAIKPTLLELGGSNAVIVLADADLDAAVQTGFSARFLNSGQSCIAGKRFLIAKELYETYIRLFKEKVENLKRLNPFDMSCDIGPLARVDLAEKLERQVNESIQLGAELVIGGNRDKAFYEPTILKNITPEMPAFREELFGPVAPFLPIENLDHAIALSNQSNFGLGVSICTKNTQIVLEQVHRFNEGAVFVNEIVKSDPRLPFGGIKNSGYGRELADEGIKSFVNVKTVYVK